MLRPTSIYTSSIPLHSTPRHSISIRTIKSSIPAAWLDHSSASASASASARPAILQLRRHSSRATHSGGRGNCPRRVRGPQTRRTPTHVFAANVRFSRPSKSTYTYTYIPSTPLTHTLGHTHTASLLLHTHTHIHSYPFHMSQVVCKQHFAETVRSLVFVLSSWQTLTYCGAG